MSTAIDYYDPREFWEPVYPHRGAGGRSGVVLDPNDFYILASREAVVVPPDHAAEMIPYDAFVGEFRVHYAGFFDPGFGSAEAGGAGSRAVLEVRSHEVPFLIEHGQIVGRLIYERLIARPDKLYGGAIGSSYQRQGLALSKHFKKVAWGCTNSAAGDLSRPAMPAAAGRGGAAASRGDQACGRSRSARHRASPRSRRRLDDDADVLVLLGEAVHAPAAARIDAAAEQPDASSELPRRRQMRWIGNSAPIGLEPGFLARLARGDLLRRLVGIDQPGDRLDLPRRAPGVERRQAELLDQHDAVALGVVQHDRDRRAAPHHVVTALAAPAAGEQAMAKSNYVDPQNSAQSRLGARGSRHRDATGHASGGRLLGHRGLAAAGLARARRGRRRVNSVNSPRGCRL